MAYILQQLLTRSAARYPEQTAVWARGRSITYRELDRRSNQLAHLLRQHGIKKGDRVGLYFPKCVESVISMLGVVKAGAVYVPLDPQAPADRVGYIIGNCGIRALITKEDKRRGLDESTRSALEFCVMADDEPKSTNGASVIPWSMLDEFPATHAPEVVLTETDLDLAALCDRAQADLDREFLAVSLSPEELEPHAHRAHANLVRVALPVPHMPLSKALGHEQLGVAANELVVLIAEQYRYLPVGETDVAGCINDDHRVRRSVEHAGSEIRCEREHRAFLSRGHRDELHEPNDRPCASLWRWGPAHEVGQICTPACTARTAKLSRPSSSPLIR